MQLVAWYRKPTQMWFLSFRSYIIDYFCFVIFYFYISDTEYTVTINL